jgi:radical SAM superfamily enzyme YgiQ (UPF0313 family)
MLVYLINPSSPLVNLSFNRNSYLNRFRLWKPLGLLTLAGLTPPDWEVTILDENRGALTYEDLPRPDLVGITAFTSQAPRAYEIARDFRDQGIPVVMGGIHASMCPQEAARYVDSVVTGEAEAVWAQVLEDARAGAVQPLYEGGQAPMDQIASARHDLLPEGYAFGAIQTTRGCSLNCSFCSVTRFNGAQYRQRPIAEVVDEFRTIPEKRVLIVDDNLIGRKPQHIERAKELFRALAEAETGKSWIGQTTVNFADDEELLDLAEKAGCIGLFIGFESVTPEGLPGLGKKSAMLSGRDIPASVERIRRHKILVVGSFIMGLDSDRVGIGRLIAEGADHYGVDNMNVLFLTPLPGTRLFAQMEAEGRLAMSSLPEDWKYYTLTYPVARYKHLSTSQIIQEMTDCNGTFYSTANILRRLGGNLTAGHNPLFSLAGNFTSRRNSRLLSRMYATLWPPETCVDEGALPDGAGFNAVTLWETATESACRLGAAVKASGAWVFRQSWAFATGLRRSQR